MAKLLISDSADIVLREKGNKNNIILSAEGQLGSLSASLGK